MDQLEAVRVAHRRLDECLAIALEREGIRVACRRKCDYCCYEPVYADRCEARLAVRQFRGLRPGVQKQVRRRLVEAVDKLKASGLLGKPEMPDVFSYLDLDIPCPFLMDRECLIYADRPMGCRSHMTKDSPDGCKTREGRKEQIYLASPESMNFSFKVLLQTQDYLLMDFFPLLLADEMEMPSAEWEGRTKVLIERIG